MSTREMICISCPMGCNLEVTLAEGLVTQVTGNGCAAGVRYAQRECTNPTRTVTSSVPVQNGLFAMVPVKTSADIPKDKMWLCIQQLQDCLAHAPVAVGDVLLANVADTGIDIVATRNVPQK